MAVVLRQVLVLGVGALTWHEEFGVASFVSGQRRFVVVGTGDFANEILLDRAEAAGVEDCPVPLKIANERWADQDLAD